MSTQRDGWRLTAFGTVVVCGVLEAVVAAVVVWVLW